MESASQIRERLVAWYGQNSRSLPWRNSEDPYHIWVSEVMLQQTQVKTVLPYYHRFLRRFPSLNDLAAADLQDVLKIWEGLGYYTRARNLHRAARVVAKEHGGQIPQERNELRRLPGVGDYIAGAVSSIAFRRPVPAVDGNVKRVLARVMEIGDPADQPGAFRTFEAAAERFLDPQRPGISNQALMELGATLCRPRDPDCAACPLRSSCRACASGRVTAYPKRTARRTVPEHRLAAGVVFRRSRILITRRGPKGLLAGLWEFPTGELDVKEEPEAACIRSIREQTGLSVRVSGYVGRVRHAYTHFKIVMDVFCCQLVSGQVRLKGPADHRWILLADIPRYPFPRANHKFIPLLEKWAPPVEV